MHWRVLLGTAAVPSSILLFIVFLCPESPRFLIRRSEYKKPWTEKALTVMIILLYIALST
jgi:hypothetical protein